MNPASAPVFTCSMAGAEPGVKIQAVKDFLVAFVQNDSARRSLVFLGILTREKPVSATVFFHFYGWELPPICASILGTFFALAKDDSLVIKLSKTSASGSIFVMLL